MKEIERISKVVDYLDEIKVVIFDLDDTLYQEKDYIKSGYKKIAKRFPKIPNMYNKLWKAFLEGKKAIDEVLNAEEIYSDALKEECLQIYRNQNPEIKLSEEVRELLVGLKQKGFLLGIITDGRPEGQRAKIKALGIEGYFDRIIITDELGGVEYRKPNEKAFLIMKENFSVKYSQMVYVGDNIKKDFIAPNKLGMKSIYYRNREGLY